MAFSALPPFAAWQHEQARTGFEVVRFDTQTSTVLDPPGTWKVDGCTTAVEEGEGWVVDYTLVVVDYTLVLDAEWVACRAEVRSRSSAGSRCVLLETGGDGKWRVDGEPAPHLTGCMDVDLESSALTNAFPIHRLGLGVGKHAAAPAAYVRAVDSHVERLEQHYTRLADSEDGQGGQVYRCVAPAFELTCELRYDAAGLEVGYPRPRPTRRMTAALGRAAEARPPGTLSQRDHGQGWRWRGPDHDGQGSDQDSDTVKAGQDPVRVSSPRSANSSVDCRCTASAPAHRCDRADEVLLNDSTRLAVGARLRQP